MDINPKHLRIRLIGVIFVLDSLVWGLGIPMLNYIRIFLYIILLFIFLKKRSSGLPKSFFIIIFLILYVLALSILNTTNISESLNSGMKICFSLFLYLFAYIHINNFEKLLLFSKINFIALLFIFGCIALSNIYDFGEIDYYNASIRFGASGVNITKNIILYSLLSVPYFLGDKKTKIRPPKKIVMYAVFFISALLIVLSTKRSTILILILSLLLFLYFQRKSFSKLFVPVSVMSLVAIYFFQSLIIERISNRSARLGIAEDEVEQVEWRIIETRIAIEKFEKGDIFTKILGNETFNAYEAYNLPYMFHNDFAVLLGGTGLLGLFLYIYFFYSIGRWYKKHFSKLEFERSNLYKWLFLSLFFGLIIFGISGNFKSLGGSLSISMAGLGAIHGTINNRFGW